MGNFLIMSNDEMFVFRLKFKWKYVCIYLQKTWAKEQNYYIDASVILLT